MATRGTAKIRTLIESWLVLDFFGEARRSGASASTLTTTIFGQSFLALVVAALMYPETGPVAFAAANLCLSTLLTALGSLDDAEPAARRRADRVLLGSAPVGRLSIALARAGHAAFQTLLVTIGMALPPAILLACREGQPLLVPGYLLAACVSTVLATGTLAVLLRAGRRTLGQARTSLLAGTGKALLLGFGFVTFLLSRRALRPGATVDALPIGRVGAELLPPYHLAKLLAEPWAEAWRALPLLGLAVLLLGASSWLGEGEREGRERIGRAGLLRRLLWLFLPPGPERGIGVFTATMLWRSPGLRARVLPLLGIPAAMAFLAQLGEDERGRRLWLAMALQIPGIYLPFLIAFLPRSDHAGARWVFDSAPAVPQALVQRAAWAAMCTHVLLPIQLLALAALLAFGAPPAHAVPTAVFALATSVLAARLMVRQLDELPFSRDADGEEPLEFGNLLAAAMGLAGAGAAFAMLTPAAGAVLAGVLLLATVPLFATDALSVLGGRNAKRRQQMAHATPPTAGMSLPASPCERSKAPEAQPGHQSRSSAAEPAAGGEGHGAVGDSRPAPPATTRQLLRRELVAIGVLYLVQSLLPLLIGIAFAP